jgi:polar amino acid transport system substrate-binding protein
VGSREMVSFVACFLLTASAAAQRPRDARVADLISAGRIRVALFLPQYEEDPRTGELRGNPVYMDVAQALADRLGIGIDLIGLKTPANAVECLNRGSCDIAFMASNEPSRAAEVDFSPPIVQLDYTYLVRGESRIERVSDADADHVRIAVVRNHASTFALNGVLRHAQQVTVDIPNDAFELLRTGGADAWASVRTTLIPYSSRLPGSRVLPDRYGANLIAIAVRKGDEGRRTFVSEFVEEAKSSGLVQRAIDRAGDRGIGIAVAGK